MESRSLCRRTAATLALLLVPALAGAAPPFAATLGPRGLAALRCGERELLRDGEFRVLAAFFQRPDGTVYAGTGEKPQATATDNRRGLAFAWGSVTATYAVQPDRVDLDIGIEVNADADTLVCLRVQLAELQFPAPPRLENPSFLFYAQSGFAHNLGGPGLVTAQSIEGGALAVCNRQVARPLACGFGPAADAAKTLLPLIAYTGRHPAAREKFPWIDRPVPPGGRDTWRISLRWAGDAAIRTVADDLYAAYAKAYPYQLQWQDRRPIARLFLSSSPHAGFPPPTNPRGWLNDATIDTSTDAGRATFRERLLAWADGSIRIMKEMNAQGMIAWDPEGQEHPHMISYLGDPRSLPPEMEPLADAFFQKFRDAGFRVGVCIRPQRPMRAAYSDKVEQLGFADRGSRFANLAAKIEAAKKRWGCTLFYMDSNVDWYGDPAEIPDAAGYSAAIDDQVLADLCRKFPDVLIMPEWETLRSYAYAAPYSQLNYNKNTAPPPEVLKAYPKAFLVNSPDDQSIPPNWPELLTALRRGDILYFSGWWPAPENAMVRTLYRLAAPDAPLQITAIAADVIMKSCTLEDKAVRLELAPRDPKRAAELKTATLQVRVAGELTGTPPDLLRIAPLPAAATMPAGLRTYDVTLPVGTPVRLEWK